LTAPKGKKPPNAGKGRRKGVPNKATRDVRAMFTHFVEAKAERVAALWERIAEEDPAKALDLLVRLAEFVVPKLARTELAGDAAAPLNFMLTAPPKANGDGQ
jgi:hypothetical protein